MKHTKTLTTLAAAALAAAAPLAAQAQTSTLTISVGPEPAIEPTLTCNVPTAGTLVPVVKKGTTNGENDGELIRFTTDAITDTTNEALQSTGTDGSRTPPSQPQLNVSWTRGSSTATNKYIQIKATLPEGLQSALNSALLSGGSAFTYGAIPTTTSTNAAPSTANTASHAVLTNLNSLNGATVKQKYDSTTRSIILSIAPSGTGDNAFLPALASTTLNLDLTLVASGTYRLKPLASGSTVDISWTCSKVSSAAL
jgi:hypothetical protein